MSSSVAISVITRTVDRSDHLREALESLTKQTLRNFEAVIVDMSDGEVASVLSDFQNRLPHLRHLRIAKPLSRSAALNQGITHATAARIAILDDDNLYDPTHLENLVNGLEQTDADLVYTGVRRTTYTPAGQLVSVDASRHPFSLPQLFFNNYIFTSGTAFWKRSWERVGGYDPRFAVYEDYDFLLKVAASGRIESLPETSAESRSFTGIPGRQNHTAERNDTGRCRAGIYWKHRRLFHFRNLKGYLQNLRALASSGQHPEIKSGTVWLLPARIGRDLLGWWYLSAMAYFK